MKRTNPPLKWFGGKHYLAPSLVLLMPPHERYVEPYLGGGSVLLARNQKGTSEVVNDIDEMLANFWTVLSSPERSERLFRRLSVTPFSQTAWEEAYAQIAGPVDLSKGPSVKAAAAFFIVCRQSRAGQCDSFSPLSVNRLRRGMNEQASAWMSAVDGLPVVAKRLKRVVILNDDAINVIRREDAESTFFYLDPPYLPDTRVAKNVYKHEMTVEQHRNLLNTVKDVEGMVMLSGYWNEMYDDVLKGWHRDQIKIDNKSSGKKTKPIKTECIWTNYKPSMSWEEARELARKAGSGSRRVA